MGLDSGTRRRSGVAVAPESTDCAPWKHEYETSGYELSSDWAIAAREVRRCGRRGCSRRTGGTTSMMISFPYWQTGHLWQGSLWIGFRVQDFFIRGFRRCRHRTQQAAAMLQLLVPLAIRQEAIVTDPHETSGKRVQQEAADEFRRLQGQDLALLPVRVILVAKAHLSVVQSDQPSVGDGDAVGIAGQIFQYASRRREGTFCVHDPIVTDRVIQALLEGGRITQRLELPVKGELLGCESLFQQVG